jgi:hypothetical protein
MSCTHEFRHPYILDDPPQAEPAAQPGTVLCAVGPAKSVRILVPDPGAGPAQKSVSSFAMNVGPRDRRFAPDRWPTHARVCKPEGYCSQAATPINFFPRFRKTLSEKKRRRPVVVLKVLRVFKSFRRAQSRVGTGFQDLLVYRYGAFGVQLWGFWCAVMGDQARLGVQTWELLSI